MTVTQILKRERLKFTFGMNKAMQLLKINIA